MSHVSPHSRSESERSQQQNTTAIFVAVTAAVFFAALWLANPGLIAWLTKPNETDDRGQNSETEETAPDNPDAIATSRLDWTTQVAAIEQRLFNVNSRAVKQQLASLLNTLEKEDLSQQEQVGVQNSLIQLQQQVTLLNEQSSPPSPNLHTLDGRLNSISESIQNGEAEQIHIARQNAEQRVRTEHDKKTPSIRDIRLSTNDNQDKAAALRRQIAQVQREQKEFQAKAARLAALQRDMADVERYLQPFTAPGYLQPKSDRNAWDTERTVDKEPVSLSRLKRLGALEDTMEGLKRLYIFGGGKNPALNNSRPLGSFPQYWAQHLNKPEVHQAVQRAQQLLREHGQALVEEQRLSP